MKRYLYLAAVSATILLIAIIVAIQVDSNLEIQGISLNTLSDTVTVGCSIVTLAVALALYRRFNGSQAIVDEQTRRVIDVLRFLSEIRLYADIDEPTGGEKKMSAANIKVSDYMARLKHHKLLSYPDAELTHYISPNLLRYAQQMKIFASEPYLPKDIVDNINAQFVGMYVTGFTDRLKKPAFVVGVMLEDGFNYDRKKVDGYIDAFFKKPVDAVQFVDKFQKTYIKCREWLRKNNPDVFNTLNFDEIKSDWR